MKKTTLTLALGLCISIGATAQTQRTILLEEWTGETCPNCPPANQYLYPILHQTPGNYPNKILRVSYPVPIPDATGLGANSQYIQDKSEIDSLSTFYWTPYGTPEAPYTRFNGIELQDITGQGYNGMPYLVDQPTIDDSAIVNAPFALSITHSVNATADSIAVSCKVTAAQAYTESVPGNLKLHVALEESHIHYTKAPGSNGETDFYDVLRKMVPNLHGTGLKDNWANTDVQNFSFKVAIPSYIFDKSQIAFVGWVQDETPVFFDTLSFTSSGVGPPYDSAYAKRVHQAAYSAPVPVTLDAAAGVAALAVHCTNTITPIAIIRNAGATTLTACTITYSIDAGTAQTYSWTGSLTTGQTATITLPATATLTTASHKLTVTTSAPNGSTDQNTGNDSQISTFIIEAVSAPAPLTQGFTSATFPPANWVVNNPDGGYTWKRSATVGGYKLSTNSAIYDCYDNANIGDIDELYTQTVDLTTITTPQLRFDYSYNYFYDPSEGEYDDSLSVVLSTDCGVTWSNPPLFYHGGQDLTTASTSGGTNASFVPKAADWNTQYIDLSAYATSTNVLIKFIGINGNGNNMYLDNINIVTSTTGIAQNHGNISRVVVYPNPANNQFNVSINLATSDKAAITVYNIMGEQVFTKNYELNTGANVVNIPADQLSSGIYTILVSSSAGAYQSKISIVK